MINHWSSNIPELSGSFPVDSWPSSLHKSIVVLYQAKHGSKSKMHDRRLYDRGSVGTACFKRWATLWSCYWKRARTPRCNQRPIRQCMWNMCTVNSAYSMIHKSRIFRPQRVNLIYDSLFGQLTFAEDLQWTQGFNDIHQHNTTDSLRDRHPTGNKNISPVEHEQMERQRTVDSACKMDPPEQFFNLTFFVDNQRPVGICLVHKAGSTTMKDLMLLTKGLTKVTDVNTYGSLSRYGFHEETFTNSVEHKPFKTIMFVRNPVSRLICSYKAIFRNFCVSPKDICQSILCNVTQSFNNIPN